MTPPPLINMQVNKMLVRQRVGRRSGFSQLQQQWGHEHKDAALRVTSDLQNL